MTPRTNDSTPVRTGDGKGDGGGDGGGDGRRLPTGDAGSAVVEFITIGVLMLVPVVYLVVAVAGVQAAAFATESAAREAARIVVTAPDGSADDRVVVAVGWALRDQRIDADPARAVTVACASQPCRTPGSDVTVTVSVDVPLPAVPAGVSEVVPLVVPVSASHTQVVGQFEGSP